MRCCRRRLSRVRLYFAQRRAPAKTKPNMENQPGPVRKVKTSAGEVVRYAMPIGDGEADMNALLGRRLRLEFSGDIYCVHCGRKTRKSFNQGYCFPCFRALAECDSCIVKPELCHFHHGTCRDAEWAAGHCMTPHVVYLANSSGLKVGITRKSNIPARWMDQGAVQARPLFEVQNRYQSGLMEVAIKKTVSDRTDWRKMLGGEPETLDLAAEAERLLAPCEKEIAAIREKFGAEKITRAKDAQTLTFRYPVRRYPQKIIPCNLDKNPVIEDTLAGIKGQYLILNSGVLNVRKFAGYQVTLRGL